MENHGTVLLSNWSNASDYKATDESFDTVALHCDELKQALENRCKELGPIKQTRQNSYISNMMGTPVPLLPFCGNEEENKVFPRYVRDHSGPIRTKELQ